MTSTATSSAPRITQVEKRNGTTRHTGFDNGAAVQTWYDRYSRNWITHIVDREGCQVDSAAFDGHKDHAQTSHDHFVLQVTTGHAATS